MLLLQEASYSLSHVEPINHEENWRLIDTADYFSLTSGRLQTYKVVYHSHLCPNLQDT